MKAYFLLIILLAPLFLSAQISLNQWMTISPVSDSSHHNRNAFLKGTYNNGTLFWDQQVNDSTTRICYKSLSDPNAEILLLIEQSGIHFTHPKVVELGQGTSITEFVVFYETNEGSDIDLNYLICQPDGTPSFPQFLSGLEGNDINLAIDNQTLKVAWENNSKIYVSEYQPQTALFSQPFCIESTNGFSPAFSWEGLSYLHSATDSTLLISKRVTNNQGNWTVTDSSSVTFAGQCNGLNTHFPWFGMNKSMQQDLQGENSGIIVHDEWGGANYLRSANYNYTDPSICDFMIGVKNDMYFLAYVTDSLTEPEIFVKSPLNFNGSLNISQWPGVDSNPGFFVTFVDPVFIRVNLFWESVREGYHTIYRTYYDYIFGGTAEKPASPEIIAVPSPFDLETKISFQSQENIEVFIFDLQGRLINSLKPAMDDQNRQKVVWDGTTSRGGIVPPGSYLVVASTGKVNKSMIIIKK